MGMLFNTEATTKMVALINRHFGADQNVGGILMWQDRIGDIDPSGTRNTLPQIVRMHEVYPDQTTDQLGKTKGRWIKWLRMLEQQASTTYPTDPKPTDFPSKALPGGWKAAPTAQFKVGAELCRQIWNGLNDTNCIEIGFVVVPSTAISIGSPTVLAMPIATNNNAYVTIITINTVKIP